MFALAALALLLAAPALAEAPLPAPLLALLGRWRMSGEVRGEPVTYDMRADTVLAGRFVLMHMLDVAKPPGYEASVYLGWDAERGEVVAHWLDRFGAGFSRTLGLGRASGDSLTLRFDYPDGAFFDAWVYDRAARRWDMLFESADSTGARSLFARYRALPAR